MIIITLNINYPRKTKIRLANYLHKNKTSILKVGSKNSLQVFAYDNDFVIVLSKINTHLIK